MAREQSYKGMTRESSSYWEQMELLGVSSWIMNAQIFYGNATAGLRVAIPMGKGQHATSCKQGYGGP